MFGIHLNGFLALSIDTNHLVLGICSAGYECFEKLGFIGIYLTATIFCTTFYVRAHMHNFSNVHEIFEYARNARMTYLMGIYVTKQLTTNRSFI